MTTPTTYAELSYGFGMYGGVLYPTVDVEMSFASINIDLESDTIEMELTV